MTDTLPQSNSPVPTPIGSMAKEAGPHISYAESPLVLEIGQEVPLPHEVAKAGVSVQPTTVVLPKPIQMMGVQTVGPTAPAASTTTTVSLPLTDDQIARGLHQSIMSSWRWLAEWCARQLKRIVYAN